jgi:hypothetical protein
VQYAHSVIVLCHAHSPFKQVLEPASADSKTQ